jgi:hypothetical protein
MLVANEVARIFTRLLPNNIAPINLSLLDISLFTMFALLLPSLASWCILIFEVPVKEVSEPEKKADNSKNIIIAIIVVMISKLIL